MFGGGNNHRRLQVSSTGYAAFYIA